MINEITITSLSGRGTLFMEKKDYSSYWLGPVDWGQAEGSHNTYRFHNQVGSSIVSTSMQERDLSITGWVVDAGGDTLQERCSFLNSFISPVEDYLLEYNGKKIQFRPDMSVIYSPQYKQNNEKVRRFLIQATCPFPLFSDKEDTEVSFEQSNKMFRFPTDFGRKKPLVFAVAGKAYQVKVLNRGGFSTGFIVRIKFSGEVQNPKVWNTTTGKFVGLNHVFQRGEQLEICTVAGNKHLTMWAESGEKIDVMKDRNYMSSFGMQLQPGENMIAVECEDESQRNNMDVTLYFTPLYLEIE